MLMKDLHKTEMKCEVEETDDNCSLPRSHATQHNNACGRSKERKGKQGHLQ